MKRNLFLAAALAVAWVMAARHAEPPRAADEGKGAKAPYVHTVIFRLKADAPKDAADGLVRDAHEMLAKIPTVRELRCGRPAEKATPNIAKTDYQVGLVIFFDDADGLKTYLEHPLHLKYVEKHGASIDREHLAVYDFVDARK